MAIIDNNSRCLADQEMWADLTAKHINWHANGHRPIVECKLCVCVLNVAVCLTRPESAASEPILLLDQANNKQARSMGKG